MEDLYRRKPDIIAFSCYIWNVEKVRELTEQISLVLPGYAALRPGDRRCPTAMRLIF